MYFSNNNNIYVFSIVILLFLIPVLTTAIKERLFHVFEFKAFVNAINKAIKFQLIMGAILLVIMFAIDNLVYSNGQGNTFTEIIIESAYVFVVFGIFIYLPSVLVLNGIVWLTSKLSK